MKTIATVALLATAFAASPACSTELISTGSGVVIGPHEILTADHVIKDCTRISTSSPFTASLTVKTSNADKDLAILYVESAIPDSSIVRLRDESKPPNVRIGDQGTDQGIRNVREAPKRSETAKALAKKVGVEIKEVYLTTGAHDILFLAEAPLGDHIRWEMCAPAPPAPGRRLNGPS